MDPTKAAKIKKRTFVGAGLAAAVAALLWIAAVDTQYVAVPLFGLLMAAGGALELSRMGKFGGRGWIVPLAAAFAAVCLAHWVRLVYRGADFVGQLPERWWMDYLAAGFTACLLTPLRRVPCGPFGLFRAVAVVVGVAAAFLLFSEAQQVEWIDGISGVENELLVGGAMVALVLFYELVLQRFLPWGRTTSALDSLLPIGVALWAVPALPALAYVDRWLGVQGLGALLLLSKIGDVFGYYVGSAIGKSHPFPKLSPGKTTAGCVGSLVAACAFGAACVWWGLLPAAPCGYLGGVLAGGVVNLASQAGDLLESKAKRSASVKDSGALFGPSGGFLDLTDSLLLSVPVALVAWPLLFAAG
ncbi:MAG: phosphatidate cytidylyltransferase [Planctomycetes bacterium]|nr:phosphatidate cytidylyltransferase [Planctomycetota bacterium]MCB9903687.1 phosphatidate cytidylyltransferase [Planctomycetota bacterium]